MAAAAAAVRLHLAGSAPECVTGSKRAREPAAIRHLSYLASYHAPGSGYDEDGGEVVQR